MKKLLVSAVVVVSMMAGSVVLANPAIQGKHTGKKKGEAAVNCVYCHDTAKIEKKAGQDKAALQKGASCTGSDCHK